MPPRRLAWPLALIGAGGCAIAAVVTLALGIASLQLIVMALFAAIGVLGGLIAARRPENGVGWLMVGASVVAIFLFLPVDYGYAASVFHPGWPLATEAIWLGAWAWTPLLGLMLPMISVRFPDGRVVRRWRSVDWLAGAGTAGLALSIALAPDDVLRGFVPIPSRVDITSIVRNPVGLPQITGLLDVVRLASVVVIVIGYGVALIAVRDRFRAANGDERLQLAWLGYSMGLVAAAAVYGAIAWGLLGAEIGTALLPLDFVAFSVPVAVTIGILRYRLFDIELVLNRTLVYGSLTAILAAAYSATITLLQRIVVTVSGTNSDVVYVLAAFFVVAAFSPLRDWLQRRVDQRLGTRNPVAALGGLRDSVLSVLEAIDPERAAARLLDSAVTAFEASGGTIELRNPESRRLVRGEPLPSPPALVTDIRRDGRVVGTLALGPRRGGRDYSPRDRQAVNEAADAIGAALDLASRLGLE